MLDFAAALRPLRAAGYAGWMIVEAEQDPALAPPLTYARAGFRHLRDTATTLGFTIQE
jgi:inosose dehydratase